jgi:hypothetical protein
MSLPGAPAQAPELDVVRAQADGKAGQCLGEQSPVSKGAGTGGGEEGGAVSVRALEPPWGCEQVVWRYNRECSMLV